MDAEQRAELAQLEADERDGKVLTGCQRGRLAELRRAEILETVRGWLPPSAAPVYAIAVSPPEPVAPEDAPGPGEVAQ